MDIKKFNLITALCVSGVFSASVNANQEDIKLPELPNVVTAFADVDHRLAGTIVEDPNLIPPEVASIFNKNLDLTPPEVANIVDKDPSVPNPEISGPGYIPQTVQVGNVQSFYFTYKNAIWCGNNLGNTYVSRSEDGDGYYHWVSPVRTEPVAYRFTVICVNSANEETVPPLEAFATVYE